MDKKAVHMEPDATLDTKITEGTTSATKLQADSNVDLQALGATLEGKTTAATTAKNTVTSLEASLTSAISARNTAESDLEEAFNNAVDKANKVYPNDVTKLEGLNFTMSKDRTHHLPGKVEGGSAVRDDDPTKLDIHYHSLPNTKVYFVMETTDAANLMNPASYYPASPQSFMNGKGGEVTPKNPDKATWYRIYAQNSNGAGVWSDPFGGIKLS